ncbi:MAG TPA: hypothetical protein DCE42_16955, partial [Myxococcales bacterium]|nr:hypothetical protein [Myxococcales bacterium]
QKVGKTVVSAPCTSTTDCYTFSDIAYNKVLGEFYIADGLATAPGVRIFDGATGTEKTTKPIDMKLPPASIFFYPVQP